MFHNSHISLCVSAALSAPRGESLGVTRVSVPPAAVRGLQSWVCTTVLLHASLATQKLPVSFELLVKFDPV